MSRRNDFVDGLPPEIGVKPREATSIGRRDMLKLMGASLALASGCSQSPPREKIVPAADATTSAPVGKAVFYASAAVRDGYATGILVETHEGRPTKIEGNPRHPMSLGKSSAFEQALLLQLYDPSRARCVLKNGEPSSWDAFEEQVRALVKRRDRVHFVMPPTSSVVVEDLLGELRSLMSNAAVHFVSPTSHMNAWRATRSLFGRALDPIYDVTNAAIVLCLDCDFMNDAASGIRWQHDFAARRRSGARSLLFVADDGASLAAHNADRRVRIRPSRVAAIAGALFHGGIDATLSDDERRFVIDVQREIDRDPTSVAIFVGDRQPPEVHAIAHALHARFGSNGHTIDFVPSPIIDAGHDTHNPRALFNALDAGDVDALVTLDVNIAYHWPRAPLSRAKARIHHALYVDESAHNASWFVPAAHLLESWGDARAAGGMITPIQPVIEPLFAGRTTTEILALFVEAARNPAPTSTEPHAMIDTSKRAPTPAAPPSTARALLTRSLAKRGIEIERALRAGVVEESVSSKVNVALGEFVDGVATQTDRAASFELSVRPDMKIGRGDVANVSWLLELPDPITKLTWENAAVISPSVAARFKLESGDVVELRASSRSIVVPVFVQPGIADDVIVIHSGWGRDAASLALAHGAGFSASTLVDPDAFSVGVDLFPHRGAHVDLAVTQEHQRLEGDETIAVEIDLVALARGDVPPELKPKKLLSLYEPPKHEGVPQWGMSIDLDLCTGCSACVVACQAENNVPVVGKDGVLMHREMHWLRIDRYYLGDVVDEPRPIHQPMLCQHCEMAPCEYVCPTNATVHSDDGLNQMIYNRCVGTRFCSNNCPYKVRRFNWLDYNRNKTPLEQLAANPDVTVRDRGVMEKCSYCVQRIRAATTTASIEQRAIKDGEVVTACAQACPSEAIVFGRVDDPASRVAQLARSKRAYAALDDLGVRPRTRYLAKVRR